MLGTTVSSKFSRNFPDSPHEVGPGASRAEKSGPEIAPSGIRVVKTVCTAGVASALLARPSTGPSSNIVVTMVRKRGFEEAVEKSGGADIGVCTVDRVVGTTVWRSDGNGPVTVGYVPVQ